MALLPKTLNANRLKRLTAYRQMSEFGGRAEPPAVGKQAHRRARQPQLARPAMKAVQHFIKAIGRRQPRLEIKQALKQAFVSRRLGHQQRHILFQHVDMVPRPRHVPFHQRDRTTYRMRHRHMLHQRRITNKEFRMLQQIVHHCAIVQLAGEFLLFFPDLFHK